MPGTRRRPSRSAAAIRSAGIRRSPVVWQTSYGLSLLGKGTPGSCCRFVAADAAGVGPAALAGTAAVVALLVPAFRNLDPPGEASGAVRGPDRPATAPA